VLNSFLDVDLAGAENVAVLHLDDVGSVWSIGTMAFFTIRYILLGSGLNSALMS